VSGGAQVGHAVDRYGRRKPWAVGSNPAAPILFGSARTGHSLDLSGRSNVASRLAAAEQYSSAVITDHASA